MKSAIHFDASREPVRVDRLAEALLVSIGHASPELLPLHRIGRIECRGEVEFSGAALAALLRAGVGVTWWHGLTPLGRLAPEHDRGCDLARTLAHAGEHPDWTSRVTAWEEALRTNAMREALTALRLGSTRDTPVAEERARLRLHVRTACAPVGGGAARRLLEGMLIGAISSGLEQAGVTATLRLPLGPSLVTCMRRTLGDLVSPVLVRLCECEAGRVRRKCPEGWTGSAGRARCAMAFAAIETRLQVHLRRALVTLDVLARSTVEDL
jgi:hypothetical protein